jgi:hypothetical protein
VKGLNGVLTTSSTDPVKIRAKSGGRAESREPVTGTGLGHLRPGASNCEIDDVRKNALQLRWSLSSSNGYSRSDRQRSEGDPRFYSVMRGITHKQSPASNSSLWIATSGDRRTSCDSRRVVDRFKSKLNEALS